MKKPAVKKQPAPAPEVKALPEWLDTPDERVTYEIGMWVDGSDGQIVRMTRDEYIAMKRHLAKLRGFDVKEAA